MTILIIIACALLAFGAYNLVCAFTDVPTIKTSRMMLLTRRHGVKADNPLDVLITRAAALLAPYIKLDKLKRGKLMTVLELSGLEVSPEAYTLKAYITAALVALYAVPLFFVQPFFAVVVIGVAITLWFSSYYYAFDLVKKHRYNGRLISGRPFDKLHPFLS